MLFKESRTLKSSSSQTLFGTKKKRELRPYRFSYFHLASIFNTIVGILLMILYLIIVLAEDSRIFSVVGHDKLSDVLVPIILLSLQIGVTCYNIRRQSITIRPILFYYIFFNAYMIELSHRLIDVNDMYFFVLVLSINDFYMLQIIPQTWLRSLMLFSTGGYFMLRKLEIPTVVGFICWFLFSISFFAQEFNIQNLIKSFETDYGTSNKELKQIKRALQSIPDGVAIIYDDLVCYSNYSMQKNLLHGDTNDILSGFEEIFISPDDNNFYFEHRSLDEPPRSPGTMTGNNPLFMSERNSEKSSKDGQIQTADLFLGEKSLLKIGGGGSKFIDLDVKSKTLATNLKLVEDKFMENFKELGIKNLRFLLNFIQSKPHILGTGVDDNGSTIVFTNCQHPKKNKVYDIKIKKVTWNKNNAAILVIFVDRTLKNNAELLMRANKFKDAVLAYVSHEIKTPLNAVLVNLENLKDIVEPNLAKTLIKPSINSAYLLQSTITDIDLISKIETQNYSPKISTFLLREFILEILDLFQIQITEKNLHMQLEIFPNVPARVRLCHLVLRQLLINLISNSVKYTFKGFIKIIVSMDPSEEECLDFKIIDSGVGIKEEDMDKIGRMFSKQTEKRKNFQNTGIGLGLHICTSLIQYLHGESIEFNSAFGHGTAVSFKAKLQPKEATIGKINPKLVRTSSKVPASETSDGLADAIEERGEIDINKPQVFIMNRAENKFLSSKIKSLELVTEEKKSDLNLSLISTKEPGIKKEREKFGLLVVDDNQLSVLAIKNMLLRSGITIGSAANGEIAIEKLQNCEISEVKLIIMDLNMPIMDGIECTKKLRGMMDALTLPFIPIVVSSAAEEMLSEETQSLFQFSLPKPVERASLIEIVNKYFSKDN